MALLKPWTEAITMGDALLRSADARPDHVAVALPDRSHTYGELAGRALRIARNLIGLGIEPGEHVGVLMPNGFDILATYFGVSLAGCTIVPINARFRTRELGYIVENADLACVITNDANDAYVNYHDLLRDSIQARGGAPLLRHTIVLGKNDAAFDAYGEDVDIAAVHTRRHGVSVADPAMILYTSGTTADPRGAIISHESIVRVWGGAVSNAMRLGPDDRMWNPCPMFHIAAMGVSVACVTHGMTIVTAPFFEPDSAVELLIREKPTALYPAYANILLGVLTHPRYAEVELVASSALVVGAPSTLRSLQEQLPGCTVLTTFGMTESCGCATYTDFDAPLELRSETVGPPIAGLQLRIADPLTDAPLGPDERGEIQLRGPILFDGYYKDPEKTSATFLEGGWMRTGDLGSLTADGAARYHGRIKDIIRVGGENLSPAELEAHLMTHPAVLIAQAVGIPDERLDEVPVAFVELREGAEATEEELIAYCQGAIARFKVPRHVRFVEEWPMSATKVQKFRLREQIMDELQIKA